ncbi:MAG: permease-like cell division protein FtsX [Clostridia bacterium]|nr:permease-like cell division protein FtsX [Clostridia bacterium]
MKKRYNLFYFIGEAFKGMKRNGVMTFASIAVLLSCLIVIGAFSLIVVNIDANLNKLGDLNEIVAFCFPDATESDIAAVEAQINKLDNVKEVVHRTKKEQLDALKAENPDTYGDITDEENPLSDTFTVTYADNSKVNSLEKDLKDIKIDDHDGVRKVRCNLSIATKIENLKHGVMMVFIIFLAILFVVSIFIIINTIKLSVFSRRKEISIMRYIGATGWFITLPFIIEGIFIGIVSGVVSYFIIKLGYGYVAARMVNTLQMLTFVEFGTIKLKVLFSMIGVGVATGVIGGAISLGKYLKE